MKKTLLLFVAFILSGCGATIHSDIASLRTPLSGADHVAYLDVNQKVPANAEKLGGGTFGDSGFSTDCSLNSNLVKARRIARTSGANIIKATKTRSPGVWSSCYRMTVEYYYYPGDVSTLPQQASTIE